MSLQARIAALERTVTANEVAAMAAEREAFRSWYEGLKREEKQAFWEYCLPAMVRWGLIPPYEVSPFEMSDEEKTNYVERSKMMIANLPRLTDREAIIANHRSVQNLWRGYLRHRWGRGQVETLESVTPATTT